MRRRPYCRVSIFSNSRICIWISSVVQLHKWGSFSSGDIYVQGSEWKRLIDVWHETSATAGRSSAQCLSHLRQCSVLTGCCGCFSSINQVMWKVEMQSTQKMKFLSSLTHVLSFFCETQNKQYWRIQWDSRKQWDFDTNPSAAWSPSWLCPGVLQGYWGSYSLPNQHWLDLYRCWSSAIWIGITETPVHGCPA